MSEPWGPNHTQSQGSWSDEATESRIKRQIERAERRRATTIIVLTFVGLAAAALLITMIAMRPGSTRQVAVQGQSPAVAEALPATSAPAAAPATTTSEPATAAAAPTPEPKTPPKFSASRAMKHVAKLNSIGVRQGGTSGERKAADYFVAQLAELGVEARVEKFELPNGRTSRNVVAVIPGESPTKVILGGHMDTKSPSPGANDNGTGCAALLEIARALSERPANPTVEIVFFGTEELIDSDSEHHHFGSRYHAKRMSADELANTAGMMSVDMIGYGPQFVVRTMGEGPSSLYRYMLKIARKSDLPLEYLKDIGSSGWSDHEAFEKRGLPVAWIEWRDDPSYHTTADTKGHIKSAKVAKAGQLVLDTVYDMDDDRLEKLLDR